MEHVKQFIVSLVITVVLLLATTTVSFTKSLHAPFVTVHLNILSPEPQGILVIDKILEEDGSAGVEVAVPDICVHWPVPYAGADEINIADPFGVPHEATLLTYALALIESLIVQETSTVVYAVSQLSGPLISGNILVIKAL